MTSGIYDVLPAAGEFFHAMTNLNENHVIAWLSIYDVFRSNRKFSKFLSIYNIIIIVIVFFGKAGIPGRSGNQMVMEKTLNGRLAQRWEGVRSSYFVEMKYSCVLTFHKLWASNSISMWRYRWFHFGGTVSTSGLTKENNDYI